MTISIPNYNESNRVPGFYFALDNSRANTAAAPRRAVLVGMLTDGAQCVINQPVKTTNGDNLALMFGRKSQCTRMVKAYRAIDPHGELWVVPYADMSTGKDPGNATGSIKITGSSFSDVICHVQIGDFLLQVASSGTSIPETVTKAINASEAPCTALSTKIDSNSYSVTLTASEIGDSANDTPVAMRVEYRDPAQPSSLQISCTDFKGGQSLGQGMRYALANLGDRIYDVIILPYPTGSGLFQLINSIMGDVSGRWSPQIQLYGHIITSFRGSYGDVTRRRSVIPKTEQHVTVIPTGDSPTEPIIWAAQAGAHVAKSVRENCALPITNKALTVAPPNLYRYTADQRNSLLYDGLSTFRISDDETVYIERLVTTYTENAAGNPDNSYLDLETMMQATVCLQDMRTYLYNLVSGSILVGDGSRITAGVKVTSAAIIKKYVAARYRYQASLFWVQDPDGFAEELEVVNEGNGVVKMIMPYRFAQQLRVVAGSCQFTKP